MGKARELKFRVWDNEDYMSSFFTLRDLQDRKIQFTDDCIVMQYTGLKDKNGVEIYEGDLIKVNATVTVNYGNKDWLFGESEEVGQKITCEVVYRSEISSFDLDTIESDLHLSSWGFYSKDVTAYTMEVIGNIYENSELLKS